MPCSSFFRKYAFLLVGLFSFLACKKEGCSDKKALNYDVTATQNDNGCQYCEEMVEGRGAVDLLLRDSQGASPHLNDTVISVEIMRRNISYNYANCGNSTCSIDIKVTNLMDKDISNLRFQINMTLVSGFVFGHYQNEFLQIPANEELILKDIIIPNKSTFDNCPTLEGASLNFAYVHSATYN